MSIKTNIAIGAFGTAFFAAGLPAPAQAQANLEIDVLGANSDTKNFLDLQAQSWQPSTTAPADGWTLPESIAQWEAPSITQASELMGAAEKEASKQSALEFDAITLIGTSQVELSQADLLQSDVLQADVLQIDALQIDGAEAIAYPTAPAIELAQRRRRNLTNNNSSQNFIGVAADFSYFDDVTFGVISKLSLNEQVSIRPSALIGDGYFAALVPVTYEFNQYTTNVSGFQVSPYAGAGVAYNSFDTLGDSESTIDLLLSAGADIPISNNFTLNGQLNYVGIFDDFDGFGITVGVGYNLGNLFR